MTQTEEDLRPVNYDRAAYRSDWMQVVLNQGPPCFFIDTQRAANRFCFRAERWAGHTDSDEYPNHRYVSLAALLDRVRAEARREVQNGRLNPARVERMEKVNQRLAKEVMELSIALKSEREACERILIEETCDCCGRERVLRRLRERAKEKPEHEATCACEVCMGPSPFREEKP